MAGFTGKLFAIGDIHGCYDRLEKLLMRLPYSPGDDTLVFLGDYIDRTGDSARVIDLLCRLQEEGRVVALLGNHEHMLLEYHRLGDERMLPFLRQLGVEATLASYGREDLQELRTLGFLPRHHRCFLEGLVPYWETADYIFVHAGLIPGLALADHSPAQLCEGRDPALYESFESSKTVVFGHIPFLTPFVDRNRLGIDTGASYGNMLTAVELPGRIFYHA